MKDAAEGRHPIRVVAQRTGLTPATIRAWECRYQAVDPVRSEGGQRLYSDRDVARLRMLRALTDTGRGIGMVAELSQAEAEALLAEDRSEPLSPEGEEKSLSPSNRVDAAYHRVRSLDGAGLERILWQSLVTLGARTFLSEVAGPLLNLIGERWEAGDITPAHEHLASEILEQILDRLIEGIRPPGAPTMVVSTLPGERHGLGARLASAAACLDGWNVVYLGTDLPVEEVAMAVATLGAEAVAISVVRRADILSNAHNLARLRNLLDVRTRFFIGGGGVLDIPESLMPAGLIRIHGLEGFAAHRPPPRTLSL